MFSVNATHPLKAGGEGNYMCLFVLYFLLNALHCRSVLITFNFLYKSAFLLIIQSDTPTYTLTLPHPNRPLRTS